VRTGHAPPAHMPAGSCARRLMCALSMCALSMAPPVAPAIAPSKMHACNTHAAVTHADKKPDHSAKDAGAQN